MPKPSAPDLSAFIAVAKARSFTRAAAELGLSQSALSQTIRALETRVGVPLLRRSTRSVSPTDAGERLLQNVGPRLEEIETELAALRAMSDRPAGIIRITADEPAARGTLWPALESFLRTYPDIRVELVVDYGLTDIVAERYDAGVRLGDVVAKDMIAVRIGPDMRMVVVGAPSYFAKRPPPRKPQDLTDHTGINLRLPARGGNYVWEFEKGGRKLNVRVEGQLTFNTVDLMFNAALAGFGLAYLAEDQVRLAVDEGRLVQVLDEWCQPFSGYHSTIPAACRPPWRSNCSSTPCAIGDGSKVRKSWRLHLRDVRLHRPCRCQVRQSFTPSSSIGFTPFVAAVRLACRQSAGHIAPSRKRSRHVGARRLTRSTRPRRDRARRKNVRRQARAP